MKRELFAALLLAGLFAAALWSIGAMDRLRDEVEAHLERSEKAAVAGDYRRAEDELEAALRIWRGADGYTHVFIRHAEIDSTTDAFFETLRGLRARDGRELTASYDLLRHHLGCIDAMEHISLGSVF